MRIHLSQLPVPEAEFVAGLNAYMQAREAHKSTVNVPAPFPEHELYRTLYERGETLEIIRDPLQEAAEPVNRDALAEMDALKSKVAELEALKTEVEQLRTRVTTVEDTVRTR